MLEYLPPLFKTSQEPSQIPLLVSTPNSTATIAAKAHKSALDFPDSYNEVCRLGVLKMIKCEMCLKDTWVSW